MLYNEALATIMTVGRGLRFMKRTVYPTCQFIFFCVCNYDPEESSQSLN